MGIRGIGGVFFKATDPEALASWYEEHLGIHRDAEGYTVFGWRPMDRPAELGHTVWSAFPHDTSYFEPGSSSWMINYRVDDLDAELKRLQELGVTLVGEPQTFEYGRFAWGLDCEGNKFELWQPPAADPFPVTVPEPSRAKSPRAWICDPGHNIASDGAGMDSQMIELTCQIPLERTQVWDLWTTGEGLARWLVENSRVDLRIGGPYEWYFDPDEEPGRRGGEGNKVLSFLPTRMLSFTWNSPPHLAYTRSRHTHVVVDLQDVDGGTAVTLTHLGWPSSQTDPHPQWAETYAYFEQAWGRVMAALTQFASTASPQS